MSQPDAGVSADAPAATSPRRRVAAVALVAIALLAGLAYVARDRGGDARPFGPAEVNELVDAKVEKAVTDLRSAPARSALVYRAILPSIVVIQTERAAGSTGTSGLGTGVVVNERGAVLTALHVVHGAARVRVTFADGTESPAAIAAIDRTNDIAVLAAERLPEVIVPAVLGGGGRVGDEAFAVGHPLGLVGSLTAGVISGLDREIPRRDGSGTLRGLIQFDAAVNPGNSGGPLLNRNGQVIGIVTALANTTEDGHFLGIGYAVPIGAAGGAAQAPAK